MGTNDDGWVVISTSGAGVSDFSIVRSAVVANHASDVLEAAPRREIQLQRNEVQFRALPAAPSESLQRLRELPLREAIKSIDEYYVESLTFPAQVFGLKDNDHGLVVNEADICSLAATFEGVNFLYDHSRSMESKKGVVKNPRVDKYNNIIVDVELNARDAMRDAVSGRIDEFSVGLAFEGVKCSLCDQRYENGWFGLSASCSHENGKKYDAEGGRLETARGILVNPRGTELSAVWKGAYPDTGILGLSADMKQQFVEFMMAKEKIKQDEVVLESSEDAPDEEILEEVEEAPEVEAEEEEVEAEEEEESSEELQLSAVDTIHEKLRAAEAKLFEVSFTLAVKEGKVTERHRAFFEKWCPLTGLELLEDFVAVGGLGDVIINQEFAGTSVDGNETELSSAAGNDAPVSILKEIKEHYKTLGEVR